MPEKHYHHLLITLLAVFVMLGVNYAVKTPLFESPDESSHMQVMAYIARERRLPPMVVPDRRADTGANMAWLVSYHQPPYYYAPPLYHALGALLTSWSDMEDLAMRLTPNLAWEIGWSPQPGTDAWNKNIFVHKPDETLEGSATVRAVALLRFVSLLLGAVTVGCTHATTRELWPERPWLALGAATFVALNPQFIATSSGVTNDALLNALFSLSLLGMIRRAQQAPGWRAWGQLGMLVGLAMLTKQSALLLLPAGGIAILGQETGQAGILSLFRNRSRRRKCLADGLAFGLSAAAVAGWWYARNWLWYGDPLGTAPHFSSQVALAQFDWHALTTAFRTYWVGLGWALILAPAWHTWLMGLMILIALVGVVRALWPEGIFWHLPYNTRLGLTILGCAWLCNAASFVKWAVATGAPYGRLLFPSITAVSVWVAWGLSQWTSARLARWLLASLTGVGLVFATSVPWTLLEPAFRSPYLPEGVPPTAKAAHADFTRELSLLGYEAPGTDLYPGQTLPLKLIWQAADAPDQRYTVWVQLSGNDPTRRIAGEDRWLGGTLYPTPLWRAGDTVGHRVTLEIPTWAPAPALYWVRLGLTDASGARVSREDGNGDSVVLGPWRVRSKKRLSKPEQSTEFWIGSSAQLWGYTMSHTQTTLSDTLNITLTWKAEATLPNNYKIFVHLLDNTNKLVAQDDAYPAGGAYPTDWWLPGDVVLDSHTLDLPSQLERPFTLHIGMYDPTTGTRLPAYDASGTRQRADIIQLPLP